MGFFDKYSPGAPTRSIHSRGAGISLNERLARSYDAQARMLSGEKVKNKAGNDTKKMYQELKQFVRCNPKVSSTEPLFGRGNDNKPEVVELVGAGKAAQLFKDIAAAIRSGDEKMLRHIEAARKAATAKRS